MNHIDALRALMDADRWIDRVVAQRDHLPELVELATVEEALRGLLTALKEAQLALDPVRRAYDDARSETSRLSQRAEHLDRALSASTGGVRELDAMNQELVHVRSLLADAEDNELNFLMTLEPLLATVATVKEQAQPHLSRRLELQATIAELQATLNDEVAALREQRTERAAAVAPAWLTRYDQALARCGGSGAALVDNGRCDGCRIALSPLDVDRFKHLADGEVMDCPECGRLLLP